MIDDYDCKISWFIKMQNIGEKNTYITLLEIRSTLLFKEYFE